MEEFKYFSNSRISNGPSEVFLKADLPLAGQFLKKEEIGQDKTFPLSLSFCEKSSSIQVNESINPSILFKNYFYKTGTIGTLSNHLRETSELIKSAYKCDKILELGCNDFTFLKNFLGFSNVIVGVDPSDVSLNNQTQGISLENDFFDYELSKWNLLKYGEFDLIFSSNNFAHIENIQDYVKGIENLLSKDGKFVFEVHWAGTLIQKNQFCFIYHEHLYYHTLKALKFLLENNGLYVNDVEEINIHGGSIRVIASKIENQSVRVDEFLKKEEAFGLYNIETYKKFANNISDLKRESRLFFNLASQNKLSICGYGASGQANTLMSLFDISSEDLKFIVDDSELKHGLYTPRNHIPIVSPQELYRQKPDYVYVLAYTFFEEIMERNKKYGGKFICPI